MINMKDIENIEKRLDDAKNLEANLESKAEKLGDSPRADSIKLQLTKVAELINHLENEKEELNK